MKKYTLLLALASLLFVSCSKTENPTSSNPKKIDRILLSPEYLLQLKTTDLYVGVRYFKDYTDKDEVTITINNSKGVLISENAGTIEGTNLLFRLPGITQPGDYKVKCTVKNDQNSLEKELTLRIVNDYSISSVWNSLDKTYSSSFSSYADRLKATGFYVLRTITNTDTQIQFGFYSDNFDNTNQYVGKSLIPAIPGNYTLIYNNQNLQEIKILNGEPNANSSFIVSKFYNDLALVYGNAISQTNSSNGKVIVFKNGNYTLTITETTTLVSTVITRI